MKQLKFSTEARDSIMEGVRELSQAVRATLGPKGRNVVIERKMNPPQITKDGVTVSREVMFDEKFRNTGADIVKEAAENTNSAAGDGTTTAIVLTEAIINEGYRHLIGGANPVELKTGIDVAKDQIIELLQEQVVEVGDSLEKIEQIAKISANNSDEIGKLIAGAIEKVTKDGVITVEEAQGTETYVDVVEGMEFDRGYFSPYFVTNEKMEAELNNPVIFMTDQNLNKGDDMIKILEAAEKEGRPILVICNELENQAMQTAVVNKVQGRSSVCVVKTPGFGTKKTENLEDIAALTGATAITEDMGYQLKDIEVSKALGSAEKVVVKGDSTTIVNGNGNQEKIDERIETIKNQIDQAQSGWDKEKLQERLAKMTGGVAVLYIGATSEVEMNEKKDRVEDALNATRSAIEEGIIPGGGVALIKALKKFNLKDKGDVQFGIDVLKHAITQPLFYISENAGVNGDMIIDKVMNSKKGYGYNAKDGTYTDMVDTGIIDPMKVTRIALENAASVASMFLTTECVISIKPEPLPNSTAPELDG